MKWSRYLTYIWTWPYDLIMWLVWLVMCAMWGEKLRWEEGCLVFNLKVDSWPARTWYRRWGGTCLGHVIFYNSHVTPDATGRWHPTQVHEHVHVEQYEASMLSSFIVGLTVFSVCAASGLVVTGAVLGGILWFFGYLWMGLSSWLTAVVRGGHLYVDSHHEEAAYSIGDEYRAGGERDDT